MKEKYIFIFLVFMNSFFCMSCKKRTNLDDDTPVTTFSQVFDLFWNKLNTNYVFWDIDSTKWDEVYYKYKPLFSQLDLNSTIDVKKSVVYFKEMSHNLIDGHFQIVFHSPSINGLSIFPKFDRSKTSPNFHYPYDYLKIDSNYFDHGYMIGYDSLTDPNSIPLKVILATIRNKILYFNCNKFTLANSYHSSSNNGVKLVLNTFFNAIKDTAKVKGIVFDLRNNPGGNLNDLNFLLGHFIDKSLFFGYTRSKSNTGRLDYTPWINAFIRPSSDGKNFNYPVISLTDNFTISLAEICSMIIRLVPKGSSIGETTWGATGTLLQNEVFNAGQFDVSNFLSVSMSSVQFKYLDNHVYESIGFTPDDVVVYQPVILNSGRDMQLEKAISKIQ